VPKAATALRNSTMKQQNNLSESKATVDVIQQNVNMRLKFTALESVEHITCASIECSVPTFLRFQSHTLAKLPVRRYLIYSQSDVERP